VQFARVEQVPAPGDIVQASEAWEEAAGGGGVSVVQLARAAGAATFFTALGDDEYGHRAYEQLTRLGVRVEAAFRPEPQRRGFIFVDAAAERTITLIAEKARPRRDERLPWAELAEYDAVYFCAGDPDALRAARAARVLVATARELATLQAAGVVLDALVASARDPSERYAGELDPEPRLVARTEGASGGTYEPGGGRWEAVPPPGPVRDAYGAGDSFAAGLAFALAEGRPRDDALAVAASWGAAALTRRGAHGEP
jgi:ribokinase